MRFLGIREINVIFSIEFLGIVSSKEITFDWRILILRSRKFNRSRNVCFSFIMAENGNISLTTRSSLRQIFFYPIPFVIGTS
jgi:hypothetical protein